MHGSSWGGSEELWSQTACRLKKEGHEVFASMAYWLGTSTRVVELAQHGVQIETHSPHRPGRFQRISDSLLFGGPKVHDRLRRFKPDLAIISQGHNSGGVEWARLLQEMSIPYVVIVHCNSDHWWFGEELDDATDYYRRSKKTFFVSHGNLDLLRLQLGTPLSNVEVIWSPFNVSTVPPPDWPADEEGWNFACVARLSLAAKGQDLLFQTLSRPEWKRRAVTVNLYGTGPDELVLRRMVEMLQLRNVRFCGQVSDIRGVWKMNHLLVLPSRFEGLPLSLVEAMWCGRPAIVTDVGGSGELCANGVTGFVVEAPALSSFSRTLELAWDRRAEWRQMGCEARVRVENQIPKDPVALFSTRLKALI